jgi:CspA family cold shock protein
MKIKGYIKTCRDSGSTTITLRKESSGLRFFGEEERARHFRKAVHFLLKENRSMAKGTVKRIIRERGFGFIAAEDGREVFFHRSELQDVDFDAIGEGDPLEFTIVKGKKGPQAIGVKKPSGQEASDQAPSDQVD